MKLTLTKKLMAGTAVMTALIHGLTAGTCTVDIAADNQTIDGFGFSTAWCGTLSAAKNNSLYGTLGMSLLRVRISSNTSDWNVEAANAAAARAVGVKVLGSPWSPPASMKTNNNVVHGSLRTDQYANYASYLNSAANAIGLDYVSIQNEPDWDPDYEGCAWTPTQFLDFCKYHAQNIGRPVVMPESNKFKDAMSDPTLNDSVAASHIAVVGGHLYDGGNYPHTNAMSKGKRVWMTEHYIENTQTNISNCMVMAKEISDCMNNSMNAYFWWWVNETDTSINLVANDGSIFKNGYIIGQFAKWVRPGKKRCSATYNPSTNVYVTAYHGGGNVLVAVNTGTSSVSQTFTYQNATGVNAFAVYRTSVTENMAALPAAGVFNNTFTYTLPPQSVTTFNQILSNPPANGTYKLINKNSVKALDNSGFDTTNGAHILQWTYNGGPNQKWTLTNLGGNLYKVIGVYSGNSIDISGWGTSDGTRVQLWDYLDGTNQKFFIIPTGGGYFEIVPSHAIDSCLDVSGASTADGAAIHLWQWLGGNNQQWSFQAP